MRSGKAERPSVRFSPGHLAVLVLERMTGIEPPTVSPPTCTHTRITRPCRCPSPGSPTLHWPPSTLRVHHLRDPGAPSRVHQRPGVLTFSLSAHGSVQGCRTPWHHRADSPFAHPGSLSVSTVRHNAPEDTTRSTYRCEVHRRDRTVESDLVERVSDGERKLVATSFRRWWAALRSPGSRGSSACPSARVRYGGIPSNELLNRTFNRPHPMPSCPGATASRARREMAGIGQVDDDEIFEGLCVERFSGARKGVR